MESHKYIATAVVWGPPNHCARVYTRFEDGLDFQTTSISVYFFFSLIILILSPDLYSQEYTPFYLDNAKWTMEVVTPVLGSGDGHAYWEIYTLDDTLIGEKTYRKIALRNLCEQWPDTEGNLQYNTSINTDEFLLGGLREEDQRIYFARFDQEPAWRLLQTKTHQFNPSEEYLLYDFNRSPGDTVHFSNLNYYTVTNGDTSHFTSSHFTIIDEELSASQDHRRYEIRSSSAFAFPLETGSWIEGIGSSYGLLGSYDSFLTYLRCFSVNGEPQLFSANCDPCAGLVSTNDLDAPLDVVISPNPVNNILTIKGVPSATLEKVRLFDGLGRLLLERKYTKTDRIQIDVSAIPSGILVLEISDKSGRKVVERVIVGK